MPRSNSSDQSIITVVLETLEKKNSALDLEVVNFDDGTTTIHLNKLEVSFDFDDLGNLIDGYEWHYLRGLS